MKKYYFTPFLMAFMLLFLFGCQDSLSDSELFNVDLELRSINNGQSPMSIEPFVQTFWNECTEEYVDIRGNFKSMVHVTIDGNGIPHINSKTGFSNTSGVGQTTGLKYRVVGNGAECNVDLCIGDRNVNIHCNPVLCQDGVVIFTGVVRQRLVSQSNADDLIISSFFHITYVAGDIPVVKQDFLELECL